MPLRRKASLMMLLCDGRNWLSGSFSDELSVISTDSVCLQGTVQYTARLHCSIKCILNLKLPPERSEYTCQYPKCTPTYLSCFLTGGISGGGGKMEWQLRAAESKVWLSEYCRRTKCIVSTLQIVNY